MAVTVTSGGPLVPWNLDAYRWTPLRPAVRAALTDVVGRVGNPSSLHAEGRLAQQNIARAMASVQRLLGVEPRMQTVLTSGGAEANHLVIEGWVRSVAQGAVGSAAPKTPHIWLVNRPADSIARALAITQSPGTRVPLHTRPPGVEASAGDLLVLTAAAGATGQGTPLEPWVTWATERGVAVHVDVTHAAGRVPRPLLGHSVQSVAVDGSGLGGPEGVGVLLVQRRVRFPPLWGGGGQELGMRSGSQAVWLAVALGEAARLGEATVGAWDPWRARLNAFGEELVQDGFWVRTPGDGVDLPNTVLFAAATKPDTLRWIEACARSGVMLGQVEGDVDVTPPGGVAARLALPYDFPVERFAALLEAIRTAAFGLR